PDVPEPGMPRDSQPVEQTAVADLAHFAVGWALLHEIRHLKHQQEGTAAPFDGERQKRHEDELSCDKYATQFFLSQVGAFAQAEGVEERLVCMKRGIGIYFALFSLTLISKENTWKESDTHPAESRIRAVRRIMGHDGRNGVLAEAIGYAAFAALRFLWPDAPCPFESGIASESN
ncbi:MAG TPA: phage exclusion protein Lit family protein, partial [Terracidiphilus sp.]|nr:phage exclusion protein Lit family protein [Terracidiphilus sp.]